MPGREVPWLPVVRIGQIPLEEQRPRWLVQELWGDSSVGVIGGAPKCSKTWLGLDLALSVASGTACLGRYAVPQPGPVLVYLAEDALPTVRQRVAGMARHRGLDENHAGEVAGLLACFRSLQRELQVSVILVHHTRKNTAAGVAAGQGLRGSSDIHAFGDSNLYLRRHKEQLLLSSEHRAAPAAPSVALRLVSSDAETTHLEVLAEGPDQQRVTRSLQDQVLDLLVPGVVLTRAKLRASLGVKNERLGEALETLKRAGRLNHTTTGWQRQS